MPKCLPAIILIALIALPGTVFSEERSALEKARVKAASDCVAAATLNNPKIAILYQENRLKEVTDSIVLRSNACDIPLRAMRIMHDQIYGKGTGKKFLLGEYLADLPRAVRERIRDQLEKQTEKEFDGAAETGSGQKRLLNHDGSIMLMEIGDAVDAVSPINIYYDMPSNKMRSLVDRGTLFFDGGIKLEIGRVTGTARVYKVGCSPLKYQVTGAFKGQQFGAGILELHGPEPRFGGGCDSDKYAGNFKLTFEPLFARR